MSDSDDTTGGLFSARILEWYLAVAIAIMTVVTFLILGGSIFNLQGQYIMLAILIIILISVNILNAIIQLRILETQAE